MRSAAAALASRSAGERVPGEARRVDSELSRAKERRLRRPEMLPRVAMLAFEEQQVVRGANVRRATGAGVNGLDGRQEDSPPATPLRPDQPVGLLVVEEEELVERTDVGDRGAANEEARPSRRIDRPSFAVVPIEHAIPARPSPVREPRRERQVLRDQVEWPRRADAVRLQRPVGVQKPWDHRADARMAECVEHVRAAPGDASERRD